MIIEIVETIEVAEHIVAVVEKPLELFVDHEVSVVVHVEVGDVVRVDALEVGVMQNLLSPPE